MRIGIFSDTHGNCVALDAAVADMGQRGIDRLVCLGDAVQGGPQPDEIVQRLRELDCPVVMGNADAWLLSGEETGDEDISPERRVRLDAAREWSLSRLSDADRAFVAAFQPTVTIPLGNGRNLLCFHGSPTSFDDFILPLTPGEDFLRLLEPFADAYLTGGHMHVQFTRRLGMRDTFFFNPGSVGVAYSHDQEEASFRLDPWAEYAILTVERGTLSLEFRRVPFDTAELCDVYRERKQPYWEQSIGRYGPVP
jgi:predicted phosphodiesterase